MQKLNGGKKNLSEGWAKKPPRATGKRLTTKQKEYLEKIYRLGEKKARKARANEVEKEMRRYKDPETNEYMFNRSQWLKEEKIKYFFSKFTSKIKKEKLAETEKPKKRTMMNFLSPSKRQKQTHLNEDDSDDEFDQRQQETIEENSEEWDAKENANNQLELIEALEREMVLEDQKDKCPIQVKN